MGAFHHTSTPTQSRVPRLCYSVGAFLIEGTAGTSISPAQQLAKVNSRWRHDLRFSWQKQCFAVDTRRHMKRSLGDRVPQIAHSAEKIVMITLLSRCRTPAKATTDRRIPGKQP